MDRAPLDIRRRRLAVDGVAENVEHARENPLADRRLQLPARVHHRISAGQALGGGQCDSAHAMRVELSQHFDGNFPFLRVQQRVDCRQVRIEPYIYDAAAHRNHRAEVRKTGFVLHVGFRRPNGRMNSCTIGIPRGLGYGAGIAGCGIVSMAAVYSPRRAARLQQARRYRACCAANTWVSSPRQISKAGCWMARANENANAQGACGLNLTFMAFKRAEAPSAGWPPDKNAIPGTAAGTDRKRHFTVASATSSTPSCSGQADPGSTILGFRTIPSSATPCT